MAEIKNFGLVGIGTNVQLGKAGPRLKVNSGAVEARNDSDTALTVLRAANAVASSDVVTLAQLNSVVAQAVGEATIADGFQLVLGDVAADGDGSWSPGAVSLSDSTKVSDAVDSLNEVLGKLVPAAPTNFPSTAMTITSTGNSPLLASGVTDSVSSGLTAGASVTRVPTTLSSNTWNDNGPGESGTLQFLLDGSVVGSRALTGTGDAGTYSGLVISDQKDFPVATPGFWKSIDVNVNYSVSAVAAGVHKARVNHTGAGQTAEVFFVKDTNTSNPTLSSVSVTQNAAGTLAYSSSVPHYGTGGSLTVAASIANLAGQTYYNGNPLSISGSNSILSTQGFSYATTGISTPIAQNTTSATAITPVTVNVNGSNVHNVGQITLTSTNVNGNATNTPSTLILVKAGSAGSRINEMSVPVTGLGTSPNSNNAVRVAVASGSTDTPTGAISAWTSADALPTYEAAVVAGILSHNQTNYSTGYLPAGPDLSTGRSGAQYVTFSFNRTALSQFKIVVTGTYAGCWVKLPGVSDNAGISPNSLNGWWNGFAAYDGAGVPGEAGDSLAGCATGTVMAGASGTYAITFGTQTSSNSTGNEILVRFKLNAGQSITALSFTN